MVNHQQRDGDPLILTARLDPQAQQRFQNLRDRHFPAQLNIVPAHLSLFHHLPSASKADIDETLRTLAAEAAALPFETVQPRFLGRGVALDIKADGLVALRAQLASQWKPWLTPQDRQRFQPHVTIQNKVEAAEARQLFDQVSAGFPAISGTVTGLDLWFYRGGPWERASDYLFHEGAGLTRDRA